MSRYQGVTCDLCSAEMTDKVGGARVVIDAEPWNRTWYSGREIRHREVFVCAKCYAPMHSNLSRMKNHAPHHMEKRLWTSVMQGFLRMLTVKR